MRRSRRGRFALAPAAIEHLEPRLVLTTVTAYEQYFLELLNQARANPTATAQKYHIDLNEGLPAGTISTAAKQPLALNDSLQAAIEGHLADELSKNYFAHQGSDGSSPFTRMINAGYTNWSNLGENLGVEYTTGTANVLNFVNDEFANLFIDTQEADRGHRTNMMLPAFQEVGSGVQVGSWIPPGTNTRTQAVMTGNDFGAKNQNSFLTGVAYNDAVTANSFYTVGEGLAGVAVVAVGGPNGATFRTTTNGAGGYQLQLPAGTYAVTFSGTGVTSPITKSFTIGTQNVKVDLNTRVDRSTGGPPVLSGASVSNYIENGAAKLIDSAITITDSGRTTLSTATITLTTFLAGQDALGFIPVPATMGNIALTSNSGGVMKLTSAGATATLAQWQAALRAVSYSNTSNSPTTTARNVSFVVDDGQATNHLSNSLVTSINVTAVNDAPAGAPKTATTLEDKGYVFGVADFGFTDPLDSPANTLLAVKITTLPTKGTLTDNGVAILAGGAVPVADITGGKLKYTPVANANGAPYSTFTFQVQDNGGTANGGVDTDPTARTMTINVTSVNDAPVGTAKTVTTLEDIAYAFKATDFGITDPLDTPANTLLAVKVKTLPVKGTLTDKGLAIAVGATVPVADINGGLLKFTPVANTSGISYASFLFQVQDNGGTANGGVDTDIISRTMTVNVTSVNDAPVGVGHTLTMLEENSVLFKLADFGFTDPLDAPANALAAVKITTLPAKGSLTNNGVAVIAGQFVSAFDIANSHLKFTPVANANGTPYATFTFQVQDNGGTANGGKDTDPTPRTMTLNVTSVNDLPLGKPATVTTLEDTAYAFKITDFGFSDPNDTPANKFLAVKITTLPSRGTVTNNGLAVTAGTFVNVRDVIAGLLKFKPALNGNGTPYIGFTFQVQDDGGTANGGHDTDLTPRVMTINVTPVNDAPVGTNHTVSTALATVYGFKYTDFGYTDPNDSPINTMLGVKITTLPSSGQLTDNGIAVTAGQFIPVADITGGKLKYTPAIAVGVQVLSTSFTFQVQDNGGTANGGVDLDSTPRLMTISLTAV